MIDDPADGYDQSLFAAHRERCRERYATPVWRNLDILVLHKWVDAGVGTPPRAGWRRELANQLLSSGFLEQAILRRWNRTSPPKANCRVLIPFTSTYRPEYEPFLRPVLQHRQDAPEDVTVFTTRRAFDADDNLSFDGATLLYEEDLFTLDTYRKAREVYREISGDVDALCRDFDLSTRDRRSTRRYFKRYCLDSVLFQSVLKRTRPDVLYAVQFTSNRGYLDAIRGLEAGETPTSVVVQHGAFRNSVTHPFVGADHALLWGGHFEAVLAGIDTALQPDETHVVGNPNLQAQLAQYGTADRRAIGSPPTVAYVSTLVDHSADAMRMFATVVNEHSDMEVVYKPHPSGEIEKYHSLCEDGLVREAQIERQRNVYSLIADSDVVVGTETTVLPEAVAFDVPAIQLLPERGWSDWAEHGLFGVSTVEELDETLSRLVADPNARAARFDEERPLAEQMFDDVETASETIAAFVSDLT